MTLVLEILKLKNIKMLEPKINTPTKVVLDNLLQTTVLSTCPAETSSRVITVTKAPSHPLDINLILIFRVHML